MPDNLPMITSRQNDRVKHLVKLREKRHRSQFGQFLIEGIKELSEALKSNIEVTEIFFCDPYFSDQKIADDLLSAAKNAGAALQRVSKDVFDKIAFRENPDGLLALAKTWVRSLNEIKLSTNPLLLVLERVEKPGNLGNLIRSAEATGVDALIICEPITDVFNPNVIRASRGMVFSLPIVTTTNQDALQFFTEHKITPVLTTPHTDTLYWDADFKSPSAILVGSECEGLSDFWLNQAHAHKVKIPLHGQGDSLNASVSGVLVTYEALRQRR